jgi:hypothetical protein
MSHQLSGRVRIVAARALETPAEQCRYLVEIVAGNLPDSNLEVWPRYATGCSVLGGAHAWFITSRSVGESPIELSCLAVHWPGLERTVADPRHWNHFGEISG